MYIVFLGAPGAGKGTQAIMMAQELDLAHLATGDLFRQAQAEGTELGLQAKSYMEKGMLVPDEITIKMVLERLSAPDYGNGVILDGFPRNLDQAKALDKAFLEQGKTINKVVYIKVDEGELIDRLSGRWICRHCQTPYHATVNPPKVEGKCDRCGGELYQRPDDTAETVKERLKVYFSQTAPLIDYYIQDGKLWEVDGKGELADISKRIVAAIKEDNA